MAQETQTGTLYHPRGVEGGGRWEVVQKRGDICIPMADSCWGLTENNKILYSNYHSKKKIKKKKKKVEQNQWPAEKVLNDWSGETLENRKKPN